MRMYCFRADGCCRKACCCDVSFFAPPPSAVSRLRPLAPNCAANGGFLVPFGRAFLISALWCGAHLGRVTCFLTLSSSSLFFTSAADHGKSDFSASGVTRNYRLRHPSYLNVGSQDQKISDCMYISRRTS